jgi:hypothetical protein
MLGLRRNSPMFNGPSGIQSRIPRTLKRGDWMNKRIKSFRRLLISLAASHGLGTKAGCPLSSISLPNNDAQILCQST